MNWYELERDIAYFCVVLQQTGVVFDAPAAQSLLVTLENDAADYAAKVQLQFPPMWEDEIFIPKANNKTRGYVKGEPFTKRRLVEFNPNSNAQIADRLITKHGWQPTVFTESGAPCLKAAVLSTLPYPEAETLARLKIIGKRITMMTGDAGWFNSVSSDDGRLHTQYFPHGTVTGRATHRPNISQVPKVLTGADKGVTGGYGVECRRLFGPTKGWYMVGADMKGLELRCLAGALAPFDGGDYAKVVCEGDPHAATQAATGLASREKSKTLIYACVPMDTQALAKRGWVGYDDLRLGEMVLTYNAQTRMQEWKPVLEKVFYPEAPIIELRNETFVARCTPNHRWFTLRRTGNRHSRWLVPEIVEASHLTTEHNIIVNAPLDEASHGVYDCHRLPKYGTDWIAQVLSMTQAERHAWLCGFCLADGHWMKTGAWTWCQKDGAIADAAIIASYLGFNGRFLINHRDDKWSPSPMTIGRQCLRSYVTGNRLRKTEMVPAPVWCIRTENESWVMRQGNQITITGNTIFGCGDYKAGTIVEPDQDDYNYVREIGAQTKRDLIAGIAGFAALFRWLERNRQMIGLDGRELFVRKPYAALNTLLQSTGSILCKRWLLLIEAALQATGLTRGEDYEPLIWNHDEIQHGARTWEIAEIIADIAVRQSVAAGEYYAFPCPTAGDAKIGRNWSETH